VTTHYGVKNEITRYGILVNEETEECIVEFYLKNVLIYPIPNKMTFNFSIPRYVTISRNETVDDLVKKIQRCLNWYMYSV
jgi:hypothetical protein